MMKSLKTRIKNAIYELFKEQIRTENEFRKFRMRPVIEPPQIRHHGEVVEIQSQLIIDPNNPNADNFKAIERCKSVLVNEALKMVHVDPTFLSSHHHHHDSILTCSLFIAPIKREIQ